MKLSLGFMSVMHESNQTEMSEDEQAAGRSERALYTRQQLTGLGFSGKPLGDFTGRMETDRIWFKLSFKRITLVSD